MRSVERGYRASGLQQVDLLDRVGEDHRRGDADNRQDDSSQHPVRNATTGRESG